MSGYAEGLPETQLPAGALFLQKPFSFSWLLESLRILPIPQLIRTRIPLLRLPH
jgi:hypothetical protein